MPKDEAEKVAKAKGPGIEDAHIYHVASDGFEYFAQEIVFAQVPPNKSAATTELSNMFLSRLGGDILNVQKTMQGEYPAEAAKVRLPTGAYQDFRFFFVGKKFFVLGVQRPKGRENSPDADNFFDSFQAH